MIQFSEIRVVHLELSSLCNAVCPLCPRNYYGYPHNSGYTEKNLTLEEIKIIFKPDFLSQLKRIWINGNFGDAVMNPDTPDIVKYFRDHNPTTIIEISTNGSARNSAFWKALAKQKVNVLFCIDGLEDTHYLYRQNTVWSNIIKNAKTFIDAGGIAVWKMIRFDHNKHQIDECKQLAKSLGFNRFDLVDCGRDTGPVFNNQGQLTHILGNYTGKTDLQQMLLKKTTDLVLPEDIGLPKNTITCSAKTNKSIYISSEGNVSPCCWVGFGRYGQGDVHSTSARQLETLIRKNNALEYPIEECIKWFADIESSWGCTTYEQGRLVVCDSNCGK